MSNAKRDENRQTAWMGISSVDGVTPIPLTIAPATGRLRVKVVGHDADPIPGKLARRDENRVPAKLTEEADTGFLTALTINLINSGVTMEG